LYFDAGSDCIGGTNDAIFLRDRNTGKIFDALTYYTASGGKTTWNLAAEIQKAIDQNVWKGPAALEGAVQKGTSEKKAPYARDSEKRAWRQGRVKGRLESRRKKRLLIFLEKKPRGPNHTHLVRAAFSWRRQPNTGGF
jgi:hypothetical protein